ncbi:diaminopropionate ammonia-lyase [Aristaeella hokkaidonensis]|uniref:Diaminopropionate ammonia-lyase n=1 Tax=Aristaeella hokkaidonensis TaxID=3046382 RepID=A0AC61MXC8_9FIRM|nr:diaminopropionate ammonia-lyase [Aristaeella hokkaidonensis]QUC66283.1 diaminopropionate ammonia-lyase [Aristaeella hokkaidonensis]SNT94309.1 L-threonine ammonia-lyase [Aristaeella hokkaidonensis]
MKELHFDRISVLSQEPVPNGDIATFSDAKAAETLRFHRSIPVYAETRLVSMQSLAEQAQVRAIFVKDESSRFGLKAFKGLGGSYCMFRILCERFGLNPAEADYTSFLREDIRKACGEITFATATDGNHGKGVSWAAKLFGCKARVFMPKGTVEARRLAIEEAGSAIAEITEWNYDHTVRYAASLAEQNGWILIQDTAWDGYEQYPAWIIEGYLTLAAEAVSQMNGLSPTHIFLQAGVGSMAAGIEAYFINLNKENPPLVSIVEPKASACIYESALAGDGKAHTVAGNPVTIMAGLNCGTPCSTIWPILRDCSAYFCACDDAVTEQGMRAYAHPAGTDTAVVSGESGAVTYGLLLSILESEELRSLFRINKDSVVLLISTEGDTDPDGYRRVVE